MRAPTAVLLCLAATATLGVGAARAEAPGATTGDEPAARIARLPLLDLRGDLVSVRYSAGALQRASQIQDPFELLVAEFAKWSGQKNRIGVLLLSREEWEAAGIAMPYGLPARVHGSNVASAAWGDPATVDLWGRLLGWDMPAVDDAPLRSTSEEAASLVAADLLGLFEGARILMEQAGYGGTEAWVGEVLAHTVAATVIARAPGAGMAGAARLYGNLAATRADSPPPLANYRSGLSIEEWLWFQASFFEAARMILDEERRGTGKSVVKLARKNDGRVSRADLIGRYPMLDAWLRNSFAATP